ncbi:alpha/beta hydrolase [Thalassococcus lentus]|uniref:Alpha/beta hydrolase n=1 Tax=Thalassococcus lentus TaxID=1210524 RepID=A0ABT4XT36_9RHOB|nr:alpha/beta hydrolase [Thalassococcus lentus]MDA7424993.1 alpha/beta hydrolase [Thalassococcus lentus]
MADYVFAETKGEAGAPLVFTFHGTGGSERQFHDFPRQFQPDAHVISPRGDVSENGALRFFKRRAEGLYDMDDLALRTEAMAAFVTHHAKATGATRVIGLGYSNGANILASTAMHLPELFTDLALLHPLIPWQPQPRPQLSGTRVLVSAGERDPICPPPMTQEFVDWLDRQGADLSVHWHPGGHEISQSEVDTLARFLSA